MILGPLWQTNLLTFVWIACMMSGRFVKIQNSLQPVSGCIAGRFCWIQGSQWHNFLVGAFNPFQNIIRQSVNLPQIGVNIKNIWNHHLVFKCFYQACSLRAGPPAEAGYAATEGAPDLVHRRLWCMTGCFQSPTLVCGEKEKEQEQGGDLHFLGESKGQLENWYYL